MESLNEFIDKGIELRKLASANPGLNIWKPSISIEEIGKHLGVEAQKQTIQFLHQKGFNLQVDEKEKEVYFYLTYGDDNDISVGLGYLPKRKERSDKRTHWMASFVRSIITSDKGYLSTSNKSLLTYVYQLNWWVFPTMPAHYLKSL